MTIDPVFSIVVFVVALSLLLSAPLTALTTTTTSTGRSHWHPGRLDHRRTLTFFTENVIQSRSRFDSTTTTTSTRLQFWPRRHKSDVPPESVEITPNSDNNNNNNNNNSIITVDVIVVGAGIGGLSCAALSAKYGYDTLCVEAHDTAGGVAHTFSRYNKRASPTVPFTFDSGPSLISGLSNYSTNPLRQVLDALNVADTISWHTYDGWLVHDLSDNTTFKMSTGDSGAWEEAIELKAGRASRQEWCRLKDTLLQQRGLSEASTYVPPFALRGDISTVRSLAPYLFKLVRIGSQGAFLTGPFSKVLDHYQVHDEFVRRWFDYLSFALSGLDANHTQAAPVVYMMRDLHKQGAVLDYPLGGMDALIQALVLGLERHGGTLQLNRRVERFLLEQAKNGGPVECRGVVLHTGQVILARQGVVCNAPLWNMAQLLQQSVLNAHSDDNTHQTSDVDQTQQAPPNAAIVEAVNEIAQRAKAMTMTGSFMHLHLGIPKDGLPADLECHHSVLDMSQSITAEQNLVIVSIPTVFDPSLAPDGYHIVHAYTAACDTFDDWEPFLEAADRNRPHAKVPAESAAYARVSGYADLKEQRAQVLWRAVERIIPDVRQRAQKNGSVELVGTPLTHRRYNQRYRGTYGPSTPPGKNVWELPGATTNIKGLLVCGDTSFPGRY
jgi:phytoene dehydrogenase-like protein